MVARGEGHWEVAEMGDGGQEVQTSSYEMKKSWGCDVQHGKYTY